MLDGIVHPWPNSYLLTWVGRTATTFPSRVHLLFLYLKPAALLFSQRTIVSIDNNRCVPSLGVLLVRSFHISFARVRDWRLRSSRLGDGWGNGSRPSRVGPLGNNTCKDQRSQGLS
jgi:hypothetical protein